MSTIENSVQMSLSSYNQIKAENMRWQMLMTIAVKESHTPIVLLKIGIK